MKKAFLLLFLSLAMLPSVADYRRVDYAGYRIGNSEVSMDQARISGVPCQVYDSAGQGSTSVTLTASPVNGQKLIKWWAYQAKDHSGYVNIVNVANDVYSFAWTYNTTSYSPSYVVVDYDYIKYNLSYNANGGSGTLPSSQSNVIYTNEVEIAAGGLSKKGYTLDGWTNTLMSTVWHAGDTVTGESLGLKSVVDGSNVVLFAKWMVNSYAVTLDRQSGSGGSSSVTAVYDAAMPSATMPTRTGYTFGGYYIAANGGGAQYYTAAGESARNWDVASNATLCAKWTAVECAVTLDKQDGMGGTDSVTATYDSAMPKIVPPTRSGYTFGGYYTAANGSGTQYYTAAGESANAWNMTTATTLYAKWTANDRMVELDWQGGSGGTPAVTATFGQPMPAAAMPTRTGYTFDGYYSIKNGGGEKYYNDDGSSARTWDIDDSKPVLYANWKPIQYKVDLDHQGGSNGTESVTAKYDEVMPQIQVPIRHGYDFGGYYTAVGGDGTQYYAFNGTSARKWDMTASTTLYAKWTAKTSTVTLDRQGGSGGTSSVRATYDAAMPSATMPTRTGYTFGGYYTAENGSGTQYYTAAGESARNWDVASNVTLCAKWTAKTYTFTRDPNGGKYQSKTEPTIVSSDAATPLTFNESYYWSAGVPERTGYAFAGWWTTASGGTIVYDAKGERVVGSYWDENKKYIYDGDLTVYAHWTARTYTVTLDKQGGIGGSDSVSATYNSAMPYATMPTRTGYTFGGYFTETGGKGVMYYNANGSSARSWPIAEAKTLYAKWTAKTYNFTRNPNGGTINGSTSALTISSDAATPLTFDKGYYWSVGGQIPERAGYTFAGWYTAASDGTIVYDAEGIRVVGDYWNEGKQYIHDGDLSVYAHWTAKTYNFTRDPNGGIYQSKTEPTIVSSDAPTPLTYDEGNYWEIGVPERAGYAFAGWYTAASGDTMVYDTKGDRVEGDYWNEGKQYIHDGDLTVYANWTAETYTVAFSNNCSEASGTMDIESFTYDEEKALYSNAFTRVGYTFAGWATNSIADVVYSDSQIVSNLTTTAKGVVTLFAKWNANEYTVTFSNNCSEASGTMLDESFTYDVAQALTSNAYIRVGYTFAGWATNSNAEVVYSDGEIVSNLTTEASDVVPLYATWQTNAYTVVFDANGGGTGTMDPQSFVYDQEKPLSKCTFKSNLVFLGWATNLTGDVVFGDGVVVSNLTAEAGGTVNLYAVWNNGDLSKAMHCDNLYWTNNTEDSGTVNWIPCIGDKEGYDPSDSSPSGSSVCAVVPDSQVLSHVMMPSGAEGPGRLSFWYKMSSSSNCRLTVTTDDDSEDIPLKTTWTKYGPVDIDKISTVQLVFVINVGSVSGNSYTVWIDQMTWEPAGSEPTEDDKPTITGFTATAGGFRLSVDGSNISDSFGYQILATNELVVGDWPVKTNLTAEALKAGYDIVPEEGEPTMFYKVKVVPK